VKAYAAERITLETITELRARTKEAAALADRARLEDQLEVQIERLLALQESYPDLKASENFMQLSRDLVAIEDHLQYARRYYNGAVRQLNTFLFSRPERGPSGRFQRGEFFEANAEQRSAP
jgi:LemA protein